MKNVLGVFSVLSLLLGCVLLTGGNNLGVLGLVFGMVGFYFLDKKAVVEE